MDFSIRDFLNKLLSANLKGDGGIPYILMVMVLLTAMAFYMVGGVPKLKKPPSDAERYEVVEEKNPPTKNTNAMQLRALAAQKSERGKAPEKGGDNKQSQDTIQTPGTCTNVAVGFLLDQSSSMQGTKQNQLVQAVDEFSRNLPDTAVFAMHTFSEPPNAAVERVGFNRIGLTRNQVASEISRLNPTSPDGSAATYMRSGFEKMQSAVNAAIPKYQEYKFYLILISDGVPELDECANATVKGGVCKLGEGERNYDLSQDPTYTQLGGPNIPEEIKAKGVTIYSVGIFDARDQTVNPDLETLLQNIASPDGYITTSRLSFDLARISTDICG